MASVGSVCEMGGRDGMTTQESIQVLNRLKAEIEWDLSLEYQEALDEAIEALEKQIPMKMMEELDISGRPIRVCGNCEDEPGYGDFFRWCGQRIGR